MVTGAGGSIGSELCRQILLCRPRRLVLFEISEIALYTIERELAELNAGATQVVPVLGSVTDARTCRQVLSEQDVDVVLHAAAYKHVPLVEANPLGGLMNNVLGTRTLADACVRQGVKRFLLVSTDKAVRPTNVMGASKRMSEMVVQDLALRSDATLFSIVRFGNVLGSSGSVIPLFKEQIARGGPVTLTHEDVSRYFMTITEAARLVMLAGSFSDEQSRGRADVFVLDMGRPVRIRQLAEQMIHAAGYTVRDDRNPDGDIEIRVIGLRPAKSSRKNCSSAAACSRPRTPRSFAPTKPRWRRAPSPPRFRNSAVSPRWATPTARATSRCPSPPRIPRRTVPAICPQLRHGCHSFPLSCFRRCLTLAARPATAHRKGDGGLSVLKPVVLRSCLAVLLAAATLSSTAAPLRAEMRPTLSFQGVPGLIDMPSGESMPDGTVNVTIAAFGPSPARR